MSASSSSTHSGIQIEQSVNDTSPGLLIITLPSTTVRRQWHKALMHAQVLSRVHAEHVWRTDHLRFTRDTVRALYTRLEELMPKYPGEIHACTCSDRLIVQTYSIHLHTCISCLTIRQRRTHERTRCTKTN